jgi:hypothetical protein
MSGDEPKGGAEASAQKWPPEDYALWVQSQIANRMFGRIVRWVGSISILTVLAIGTALYTYSEQIIDRVKQGIVEEVTADATQSIRAGLPETVRTEVLQQLIQQAGLVETARGKVLEELNRLLEQRLADAEFQARAADAILLSIDARGGVTRVLRDNALMRARSEDSPDAVRAFGVELFTLLATGEGGGDAPASIRQNLLAVASARAPGPNERVLRALLEHYPLNDHGAGDAVAHGCEGREDICTIQDARMVRLMLTQLLRSPEAQRDLLPEFRAFFRRMAPEHYRMLADRTARDPANAALVEINLEIARSGAPELRAALLRETATMATAPDRPELQALGLQILAALDPEADFGTAGGAGSVRDPALREAADRSFDARSEALVRLWTAQPPDLLRAAFQPGAAATDPATLDPRLAVTRAAIVNLLRTGSVADPEAERHDWRDIVETRLTPDLVKGPDPALYAAWVARARLDAAAGRPVDWAADRVLEGLVRWPQQPYADPLLGDAAAFAIDNAGDADFGAFAATLVDLYRTTPETDAVAQLVAAAVARERRTQEYGWIETVLAEPVAAGTGNPRDAEFANLVMANLSNTAAGGTKDGDPAAAVLGAAEFAAELYGSDNPQRHRVAGLALARVLTGTEQHRCAAWVALEDSGIVADLVGGRFAGVSGTDEGLRGLRARAPWIGVPPEAGLVPVRVAPESSVDLRIEGLRGLGGGWQWITLDAPLTVSLRTSAELDLVLMTADRATVLNRLTSGGTLQLPAGTLALGLRDCRQGRRDSDTVTIAASSRPEPLAAATRETPQDFQGSSRFRYDGLAASGEVWLRTTVTAGEVALVETRRGGGESPDLDTQLWLYDATTGEELATNDDAIGTLYSRIAYVADADRSLLIRVAKYLEAPFVQGDVFDLRVDLASAPEVVQLGTDRAAAPQVEIGRPVILAFPPSGETVAYLALRPLHDTAVMFDSGAPVRSVTEPDGSMVPGFRPPDGTGPDVYLLRGGRVHAVALEWPGEGSYATFQAQLFPAYRDLTTEGTAPPAPVSLDGPSALSLPAGRSELDVRAGPAGQVVRVALSGDPAALVGAALEISTGAGAAQPVFLSPGRDGLLQGEWADTGGEDYKIAFVFGSGSEPVMAALQMSPRRGYLGFGTGDRVRLDRHDQAETASSYNEAMVPYIGCIGRITDLLGEDAPGSDVFLVRVDLPFREDVYDWIWRAIDLEPVPDTEPQPAHCPR